MISTDMSMNDTCSMLCWLALWMYLFGNANDNDIQYAGSLQGGNKHN